MANPLQIFVAGGGPQIEPTPPPLLLNRFSSVSVSDFSARNIQAPSGIVQQNWSLAPFALEILQPQPSLTTASRWYRNYPGLEYNVRMGVRGGAYPYFFELTTAPSGMTIDSFTGKIVWPNPTTSGSPHSVTARVTDQEGTQATRSWTITVTTSQFIFQDASASPGGDGSIGSPFQRFSDWWGTALDDTYAGYHVYLRSGDYTIADMPDTSNEVVVESGDKPRVYLVYPGDTRPNWNMSSFSIEFRGSEGLYLDGIRFHSFSNPRFQGVTMHSANVNIGIRRCVFDTFTSGVDGANSAFVFVNNNGGSGDNLHVSDCEFKNHTSAGYAGVLIYTAGHGLVEDTWVHDNSTTLGHDDKEGGSDITLRRALYENNTSGMHSIRSLYSDTGGNLPGNLEICFSLVRNTGGDCHIAKDNVSGDSGATIHVYKNTIKSSDARMNAPPAPAIPIYTDGNVIENPNSSFTDRINCTFNAANGCAQMHYGDGTGASDGQDNLAGAAGDFTDSDGRLLTTPTDYRSLYEGYRGHFLVGGLPNLGDSGWIDQST